MARCSCIVCGAPADCGEYFCPNCMVDEDYYLQKFGIVKPGLTKGTVCGIIREGRQGKTPSTITVDNSLS